MGSKKKKKSKAIIYHINVYCQKCGSLAPTSNERDPVTGDRIYLWHQPCPNCGAEDWASKFVGKNLPYGKQQLEG